MAICARCGLSACAGCSPPSSPAQAGLPWEDSPRPWLERLWQTSLSGSTEPERVFGELGAGRVTPALGFALLAESLALGSLVLVGAAALWLLSPELAQKLLSDAEAIRAAAALLVGSVVLMLVLHVLWGVSLDVGAGYGRGRIDVRQGARFGLYACGWDLMTSPIGLFWSALVAGPVQGFGPVGAAARAARPAQRAYLQTCRGYGPDARRRAVRLAVVVVGAAVALMGSLLFVALISLGQTLSR